MSALSDLLSSALRVCSFRPVRTAAGAPGVLTILLRACLLLCLQGGQSFLLNGRPGHVEWQVLPDLVFPLTVLWLSAWVAAVLAGEAARTPELLADLLAGRVLLALLQLLVLLPAHAWPEEARLDAPTDRALEFLQLWWMLAALACVARFSAWRRLRLTLALGAFAGPWLLLLTFFQPSDFWQGDTLADEAPPVIQAMQESVFHAQPALFEDALDALEGERPGVDDLYFLGIAGDAGTTAFRNEVELADQLLGERFDTHGRSLLLVNDAGPDPQYPFATRTNLNAALARMAEVMDIDDDILMLFLSSHGTREHTVVLAEPALALADIDPPALRAALDGAGIRWRILVISACYSGGFIDALKDDHTLIITASDADHSSFGCGVADRYTWFGQAFFDEQLRKSLSLPVAFRAAARAIAAREKAGGQVPSNPQMVIGAAMAPKLAALEVRLRQPGGPAGSVQADAGAPTMTKRGVPLRTLRARVWQGQAGISGVSEHASRRISSFSRSLRFLRRRSDSSSMPPSLP
jgi:hypothetical protein